MKYLLLLILSLSIFSCAKKELFRGQAEEEKFKKLSYQLENTQPLSEGITSTSGAFLIQHPDVYTGSYQNTKNTEPISFKNEDQVKITSSSNIEKTELKKSIKKLAAIKKIKKEVDKNLIFSLALLLLGLGIATAGIILLMNTVFFFLVIGLSISLIYAGISGILRALIFKS